MYTKTIIAALAAAAPALAKMGGGGGFGGGGGGGGGGGAVCKSEAKLNLYWGQDGSETRLAEYCKDSKPDIISLAFMNLSPEHDPTGYPGTNFAGHCSAKVFKKGSTSSKLLDCAQVAEDAQKCQAAGVKVLLSIGGEYSLANDYSISTDQKGEDWATFLWQAFGPKKYNYHGPRPLDTNKEFVIDGFDFDIEHKFTNQSPWIKMIKKLRQLSSRPGGKNLYLTAAPQCPLSPQYFQMSDILAEVAFDALFVQFYNNPACDGIPGSEAWDKLNYADWETFVSTPGCAQKDTKLFIGLPAEESSGYLARDVVKEVLCDVIENPAFTHFGGVSLWDAARAFGNVDGSGESYSQLIQKILNCGCGDEPAPSSSSSVWSSSSTWGPSSTSSYEATSTSCSTSSSSEYSSSTSTWEYSSSATSTSTWEYSSSATSTSTWEASSSSVSTSTWEASSSSTDYTSSTTSCESTSESSSSTWSSVAPEPTDDDCDDDDDWEDDEDCEDDDDDEDCEDDNDDDEDCDDDDDEPTGASSSSATYTSTSASSSSATYTGTSASSSSSSDISASSSTTSDASASSNGPIYPTTTAPPQYTTSTVYATKTYTITSCPPNKGPCHKGAVTTEVVAVYTTVCPAGDDAKPTDTPYYPPHGGEDKDDDYKCPGGKYCHAGGEDKGNDAEKPSTPECPYGSSCGEKDVTSKKTTFQYTTMTIPKPEGTYSNGAAKPTGTGAAGAGCFGAGCPSGPAAPTGNTPVTAGAGSVAFSLVAVFAAAVLAL